MRLPRPQLFLSVLPALLLIAVASAAIWGQSGWLARHALEVQLKSAQSSLASVERENQRLIHELVTADRHPLLLERWVADEIGWARAGSTVYRFEAVGVRPSH